jgi:hypothetical protein
MRAEAVTQAELDRLLDEIHDQWFDVDHVVFDKYHHKVTLPFTSLGLVLTINHATSLRIADSEGVGRYDLNELRYDSVRKVVQIRTGVPLDLEIGVDHLLVRLEPAADTVL